METARSSSRLVPPPGNAPFSVVVADFNGDGRPDLAVANAAHNTVSVLLGNGDGTFRALFTKVASHPYR